MMKRSVPSRFNNFIKIFCLGMITTAPLFAGTATVQVAVKNAATGKIVKDAFLVVLQEADTMASAMSKTTAPAPFQLTVPTSAVETEPRGAGLPVSSEIIETYPNPCSEKVTLNVPPSGMTGVSQLKIINILGQRIYSGTIPNEADAGYALDLYLQNISSGLYLVQVTDSRGKTAFGKFLKIGGSAASALPTVRMTKSHPFAWQGNRVREVTAKTATGTLYTFTAYTNNNSKDADDAHVAGYASVTIPISKDTTIDLLLEQVPFSEGGHNLAPRAATPITVDGIGDEDAWSQAKWGPINQLWLYAPPSPEDFTGRYKIVWTPEKLYVLVEIRDDSLSDQYPDPLSNYYKDDCLEMFIDENGSGGIHQYSYNAFAYHISITGTAVDVGPDRQTKNFSDHINVMWTRNGDVYTWEIGIKIFADTYNDKRTDNVPVTLSAGKIMGFMAAYCDNDGTFDRQSFIGSIFIAGPDKNLGWVNASVFGTLELLP